MSQRQRRNDDGMEGAGGESPEGSGGQNLARYREEGRAMISGNDAIIRKALAAYDGTVLREGRQQGGE